MEHIYAKIRVSIMALLDINSNFIDHIVRILHGIQQHGLNALFDLLLGILVIRLLVRGIRLILKATHIQTGMRYVITSISETSLWILLTYTLLQELGLYNVIYFFTGSIFIAQAGAAGVHPLDDALHRRLAGAIKMEPCT